jgi:hypothetical protein
VIASVTPSEAPPLHLPAAPHRKKRRRKPVKPASEAAVSNAGAPLCQCPLPGPLTNKSSQTSAP